jgi:hypothetical protein
MRKTQQEATKYLSKFLTSKKKKIKLIPYQNEYEGKRLKINEFEINFSMKMIEKII